MKLSRFDMALLVIRMGLLQLTWFQRVVPFNGTSALFEGPTTGR
jgi:hypothetical protein